jgi:hypothetical protein
MGGLILLLMVASYILGAKFGLPTIHKKVTNNDRLDRIEFLSRLSKGDEINVYNSDNLFLKSSYTVVRNDSHLQAIELIKHEILNNKITLSYNNKRFKDVIEDNIFVLKDN